MRRRRQTALLLGTVLFLGTVVSPLVHYTWMATSDMYGHSAAHESGMHGRHISTADADHITCDYASLFATTSAPAPNPPPATTPLCQTGDVLAESRTVAAASHSGSIRPRGPPVA